MFRNLGRTRALSFVAALGAAVLSFTAGPPASAQISDAVLEVEVVDEAGAALPGAMVEAKRAETGLVRRAVIGANGGARLVSLPPGDYDISVTLSGFETATQKKVTLRVGQTGKVKFTLRTARSEAITVTATVPLVDVYKSDSSTNVTPEQIRDLPVPDRDFQKLAFITPGVERERGAFRFVTGGPVIGGGGNASQSTILVDGVDFTDPALGQAKTRFSQDAISEFRVINNRFDSEIGGSSGGALSVVTKSGTNTLAGSVFGFYRGESLRAKGALEQDTSVNFERDQFGFTLGGPLVKDKAHFFASFEQINSTTPILFRPQGAFVSQAADIKHPFHQSLLYGGVDDALSDSNRLTGKVEYERYREDNFRVGGIADVSYGQELNRDNLNFTLGDTANLSGSTVNEARAQFGKRKYVEPTNSSAVADWYSSGNTLQTGGNILGDLLGDGNQWEVRDTMYFHLGGKGGSHDVKAGASFQRVVDESRIDTYQTGLFLWVFDNKSLPLAYAYGVGSSDVTANTNRIGAFVQDEWRPLSNLSVNLGLRYDVDTNANDPNFRHSLVPNGRKVDTTNFQPRLGFSWDVTGGGQYVARGGVGIFTGRYLLVPLFGELQQNGEVGGRVTYTRLNGALFGFPALTLDPAHPTTTGIPSKPSISLLGPDLKAPQSTQATLGFTTRLGTTGVYADVEGIYIKGRNEIVIRDTNWNGNANPTRPITQYTNVNVYTNDGRSEYKALVLGLNGTLKGGHVLAASVTFASKHNIADDFSPEFPTGYPNDPANIQAEYGRARSYERYRIVLSGVARLPWQINVAPVFEYGAGQPWTQRLGYDYNGDGFNSDRPAGVARFGQDGPRYSNVNLRVSKAVDFGGVGVEFIAEAFNLFNTVNYDVTAIDGAMYLSGPTIASPTAAFRPNPNYGKASATLPSREIQLGLRVSF
jgi:TonB dependent receptor/Carboxypeptidase regulatory-like domain